MAQIDKLIRKAIENPKNVRFSELCKLCEYFGMVLRQGDGSHKVYTRKEPPAFSLSLQEKDGMAKAYQVRQLINKLIELELIR